MQKQTENEVEDLELVEQPEIDLCPECGEHSEFYQDGKYLASECCGARPYNLDPDLEDR